MNKQNIENLQPETKKWLEDLIDTYELEEADLMMLLVAAETYDRYRQVKSILEKEGLTYLDRFGAPKSRPEVAIERDCRLNFSRLLREAGLNVEAPKEAA